MKVYSRELVVRLLRNYLDFRQMQEGQAQRLMDGMVLEERTEHGVSREYPLGMSKNSKMPWPFLEPRGARAPRDGKRKSKQIQEIHVSMLDLETGLRALTDDDLSLVYRYLLFQTHTLEQLCGEWGIKDIGSMYQRIMRAVDRLVFCMEFGVVHETV
jgi:hypothetical protein